MNVAELLVRSAVGSAAAPAIVLGDETWTYGDLDRGSTQVAALLGELGVEAGDRVGVMLPNVPEFAVLYYGALRAGCIVVPMNPLLKGRELAHYADDSGMRLLFAWHAVSEDALDEALPAERRRLVRPGDFSSGDVQTSAGIFPAGPRDTAVILYTSGTTGRPKGAELTHGNLVRNAEVTQFDLLSLSSEDVVFGGLPLFHCFGQTVTLNATIAAGARIVLMPRFEAGAALALLSAHGATIFAGVPTMYSMLLAAPDETPLPALRICVSGGAALPVDVLSRFEARYGCTVLEGYGLSETSPVACFNKPGALRKPGSIGTPMSGVEMRIVDEDGVELPAGERGEIVIRGHNVMKGYWRRPDETDAVLSSDGWLRTGDIGIQDADGLFSVVDRKKDLVIRGGFNVYPREIEEVLYMHPAVAEAAVVGIAHPDLGEEIGAAIALRPGAVATEEEIREFVGDRVAPYKYPRVVWFVEALPKGPTGKILKREIVRPTASVREPASSAHGPARDRVELESATPGRP